MLLVTHDGKFHYDDILSTAILTSIYPKSKVIRTREKEIIDKADIVYDVGGIYDPTKGRFDHHQRGFDEHIQEIKLSSAGLIYRHFHRQLFNLYGMPPCAPFADHLYFEVYEGYFKFADAVDNGVDIVSNIRVHSLADVVAGYNNLKNGFSRAVKLIKRNLARYLKQKIGMWVAEMPIGQEAVSQCDGDILVLNKGQQCTIDMLFIVGEQLGKDIKYVIYDNEEAGCRIYAMKAARNTFRTKVPLKEEWRGLRDETLQSVSGIRDALFVHSSGFTGAAGSLKGAVEMCRRSLESN